MQASWKLQDAKARFSEVVRRAKSEGPQRVTVHGRDEAVVVSAEEFARLKPEQPRSGSAIVEAFSHLRGLNIEREPVYSPVRPSPTFDEPDDDR
jgi:antitoxin Phd